jgi:ABC-type glycerol-3-phosphate transport system substrate-binding protein
VRLTRACTAGIVAAVLVAALAACSSSSSKGGGKEDHPTLTYWASNQGTSLENDKQILQPRLDAFERQTGIKVNVEVVPWSDLLNRILSATTSGKRARTC